MLHTDEGKVSQILRNFISNALKFTEHGEVRVSADLSDDGRAVVFIVADTGIGIAKEDQEHIFEEFTQIPSALQKRVKGTGLGLPLCRNLASLLGGKVWLLSQRGLGSSFYARIPIRYEDRVQEEERRPISMPALNPAKIPVLVVEDEAETRLFYEKILRPTPYQLVPARNLAEAREVLDRVRPAAVVLDILMRGEDSWRWLMEVKADAGTQSIPVVVATTVEDERKAYALGADAYLRKPVEREVLVRELDHFLGRRILIIDDDPAIRYTLKKLLDDGQSCHIVEAADGATGLEAAKLTKPEVILLDLGLPDITGEEVLERLSSASETRGIPVVIATSRELSEAERHSLQLRTRGVLSKRDMNKETLGAMLRTARAAEGAPKPGSQPS
jgi:CheY-like chemotaxis protein